MLIMELHPLFASSTFSISTDCEIYQVLCYDYADPKGFYAAILRDEQAFESEVKMLRQNMTRFLNAEQVYINGHRVDQKIVHLDIGLRGSADVPYIQWIIHFQGATAPDINTLSSDVEEEQAEYDIEVLYLFPMGTDILAVETPMEYEIVNQLLLVWARKGDKVGGHEEVRFRFRSAGE